VSYRICLGITLMLVAIAFYYLGQALLVPGDLGGDLLMAAVAWLAAVATTCITARIGWWDDQAGEGGR